MKRFIVFTVFITFFIFCFSRVAIAQEFPNLTLWDPEELIKDVYVGADEIWFKGMNIFYYVILPFITATTVNYGILTQLRIFDTQRRIKIVLALCMAFLLLPSGFMTLIVNGLFAAGAFIGLVAFGVLFIFGTIMWFYGTSYRIYGQHRYAKESVTGSRKEIASLQEKQRKIRRHFINKLGIAVHDGDFEGITANDEETYPTRWRNNNYFKTRNGKADVMNKTAQYLSHDKEILNISQKLERHKQTA